MRALSKFISAAVVLGCLPLTCNAQFVISCDPCVDAWNNAHDGSCWYTMTACQTRTTSVNETTITDNWSFLPSAGPFVCGNCCPSSFTEIDPAEPCPCAAQGARLCTPSPPTDERQECITVEFGADIEIGAGGVDIGGVNFTESATKCRTRPYANPCGPRSVEPCSIFTSRTKQRNKTTVDRVTVEVFATGTITALDPERCKRSGAHELALCATFSYLKTDTELEWVAVVCDVTACSPSGN